MLSPLTTTQQLGLSLAAGGNVLKSALNQLTTLSPLESKELGHLLEEHRLAPLVEFNLHNQDALDRCPEALRNVLEQQHLRWTNQARLQRLVLTQVCTLLESAGIQAVALKGSYLAWHVYHHPSHRPLRDLDILVPEARIVDGIKLLQSIDCEILTNQPDSEDPLDWANYEVKFCHPLGVVIELHRGLWYYAVEGGVEDFSLRPDFWEQESTYSCFVNGIRYLSETYRYLHILVHHIYKHHLGVGPLGLHDLRLLMASPSLNSAEVDAELEAIGAPSLNRIAQTLVGIFNGIEAQGDPRNWLPLIFLTPEQNQLIYRTRRSIRARLLSWLKIQWSGGQWSTTRTHQRPILEGTLRIARRAPGMLVRPGLGIQLRERLHRLVQRPQPGSLEIFNATLLVAAEDLRQAIVKA